MPRRKRERKAGLVFHVLNRAAKRTVLFDHPDDYAAFDQLLQDALTRFEVALFSYSIMPNHWHFVLAPLADGALSRFMHWLTTTHARRWQEYHRVGGLGAVYQGRFKSIPIAQDRHFLWVCRYVERNPLRAGLVTRAEDWPWSSLTRRGSEGWTSLAEWPIHRPADWMLQVNTPQTEAELHAFRTAMRTGEPFGDDGWKRRLEETTNRPPRRPRGRPRKHQPASVL
jgi:putative transposase